MLISFAAFAFPQDRPQGEYVSTVQKALDDLERRRKKDRVSYGIGLLNLADKCEDMGLHTHAFSVVDVAFTHIEHISSDEILRKHAAYADYLGYYPEHIEGWYKNSIKHFRAKKKRNNRSFVDALISYARYATRIGDGVASEHAYKEAIKISTESRVLDKSGISLLKCEQVNYYLNRRHISDAESIFSTMRNQQLNTLAQAVFLNTRANLHIYKKEYTLAATFMKVAIQQYRQSLPTYSMFLKSIVLPEFMEGLSFAARLYTAKGRNQEALALYQEINSLLFTALKDYVPYMPYMDKAHLWKVMESTFNEMQAFAHNNSGLQGVTAFMYENNQIKKSLFLISPTEIVNPTLVYNDPYLIHIRHQSELLQNNEATYNTRHESDIVAKVKNDLLLVAYGREELSYMKRNRMMKPLHNISWRITQGEMAPSDVIVEFLEFKESPRAIKKYFALVFNRKSVSPKLVPLCDEDRLQYILNNQHRKEEYLAKNLWAPLLSFIGNASSVYISPVGLVNAVSFAGLKENGKYLCEKYDLHYLLRMEDIHLIKDEEAGLSMSGKKRGIYLFGGADYGMAPPSTNGMRGQGFGYLPGSKLEVESIERTLSSQWTIHKFTGKAATEDNFRKLAWNPDVSVIHISTHGFYLPYDPNLPIGTIHRDGKSPYYDPLMRTGLVLSGGNDTWKNETPIDPLNDCLLTAMDIALVKLPYTELVVLSACNTGLGEIRDGEGVLGMQQSLRVSGVRSMILSLDEVPDKETAEFMTAFYGYWQSGMTKSKSFINAQRSMKDKYPDQPKKWAGFVLIE